MPTAIISTYDKTGVEDFAGALVKNGYTILASGGTARLLQNSDIPVQKVSEYTNSPEILRGRVKTLHPAIHGGILAREDRSDKEELDNLSWDYIDLVAVNLYPFVETIKKENVTHDEIIEQIDIGGVALIRAAAKNHKRVTLVCDPADYGLVLEELKAGGIRPETRKKLAVKGFTVTAMYDLAISSYLAGKESLSINAYQERKLRYGENPHQEASLYTYAPDSGPMGGKLLQGKEVSYNNLLDLDAAWRAVVNFDDPTICIVKHLSPCGIATNQVLQTAYEEALASDPVSAFGSVIASNRNIDEATAASIKKLFVECIIAPGFDDGAREILSKKKKCRLIEMPNLDLEPKYELRSVNHGLLMQEIDQGDPDDAEWKVVTDRQPTEEEWQSLRFSWKACQFVKSNAIVLVQGTATVGIGGGQPNRVDCVKIASERAGEKTQGAVLASDAFFPFPDSIEMAHQAGVTAVIQPGGSIRDKLSIEAANKANMTMIFTGVRHFKH